MRNLLLRRLAPLLVLAALVVTGCGDVAANPAATVNGEELSIDSLQVELDAIRENEDYRSALEQAHGAEFAGAGKGTFGAQFTARVLSLRVYYELLEQGLAERGVEVAEADLDEAEDAVRQQLSQFGDGMFGRFPASYRRQLVRQEAVVALAAETAGAEVEVACASHILVTTENRTDAEARRLVQEIQAELDGGADFAEVARARSEDPGSAPNGGDLDCGGPGRFVPTFDAAVFEQEVGEVGDPVQTDFGYHLILVESREAAGDDADEQTLQQALNQFVVQVICEDEPDVDVNPRYGRWDPAPCDDGELALVTAPRGPRQSS